MGHSHREPGHTYLHSTALEPPLHEVAPEALEDCHLTREQGTRELGGDSVLVNADETRVLRWFQLRLRIDDIDRCGTAVRDTAAHCSSESGIRAQLVRVAIGHGIGRVEVMLVRQQHRITGSAR